MNLLAFPELHGLTMKPAAAAQEQLLHVAGISQLIWHCYWTAGNKVPPNALCSAVCKMGREWVFLTYTRMLGLVFCFFFQS